MLSSWWKEKYWLLTTKTNSQHKGDLFSTEAGNKRQRQEIEDKGGGEGNKGEGSGIFDPEVKRITSG